jgi:hypothetical protein
VLFFVYSHVIIAVAVEDVFCVFNYYYLTFCIHIYYYWQYTVASKEPLWTKTGKPELVSIG